MTEEWRPVVGFEGQYEVSNFGSVRNPKRKKLLTPYAQPTGHLYIKSLGGRNGKFASVHRLVYEAFIGPIPFGAVVRHIDGNPSNNTPGNLQVGTQKENIHDIYSYGKKCGPGKLFAEDVREIRKKLAEGAKSCELAAEYGVSAQTIYNIKAKITFYYI